MPARQARTEPVQFIRCRGLLFTNFHADRAAFSSEVSMNDVEKSVGGGMAVVEDAIGPVEVEAGAVVLEI